MNLNLKVTVIIPCYNISAYVQQCVESLVASSYPEVEVLIINDESNDDTLDKIKNYDGFKRNGFSIEVIDQKNQGLSGARNTGITKATGEWLMFIDGDDWIDPEMISEMMASSEGKDMVICSYYKEFRTGSEIRDLKASGEKTASEVQRRLVGLTGEELKDPTQADSMVTAWAKIIRRDIVQKHQLQFISTKEIGTEDALFNIQYLDKAQSVYILNKPFYHYRKFNETSLTSTYKPRLFDQWQHLYDLISDVISDKPEEFHAAFKNRICLSLIGLGLNEMTNPEGSSAQLKNLRLFVSSPRYTDALQALDTTHLPKHWKLFFHFAKSGNVFLLRLLLKTMAYLLKSKNK